MENIVLSTAAFCLWDITPHDKLRICRELDFSEIEVALSTEKMVREFLAKADSSEDICHFRRISVHAPWRGVKYGRNPRTERVLAGLRAIGRSVEVDRFIFRVDRDDDMSAVIESGLPICLENSDREGSWDSLRDISGTHDLPLSLNINRAARGNGHIDELMEEFGHRVVRAHISGFDDEKGRMPILASGQLHLLGMIKEMDVPIILEGLFEPGDKDAIVRERIAVHRATMAV